MLDNAGGSHTKCLMLSPWGEQAEGKNVSAWGSRDWAGFRKLPECLGTWKLVPEGRFKVENRSLVRYLGSVPGAEVAIARVTFFPPRVALGGRNGPQ